MSDTLAAVRPRRGAKKNCVNVMLCSPKGGTGKTTFAENLLVAASLDGFKVVGVDFDPQETLAKWAERRAGGTFKTKPTKVDVVAASTGLWARVVEEELVGREVAILDMLPSLEHCMSDIHAIARASDVVVVTTGATQNDLDSIVPWLRTLKSMNIKAIACLNRVNRREAMFLAAQTAIINSGAQLCPIEVPVFANIHVPAMEGLTCMESGQSAKGGAAFRGVWAALKSELALEVRK
jgi:chromosome partitioning protein